MTATAAHPSPIGAGIVWCASYPKSGNTWVRAMLGAYLGGQDVDINQLEGGVHVASRVLFDELGLDAGAMDVADVEPLLRLVDERVAARATTPVLRKLHDAHLPGPDGRVRVLPSATRVVVYVVRDPRAVAVSWGHHLGTTQDQAVAIMRTAVGLVPAPVVDLPAAVRVGAADPYRLGTWSDHVRSWLDQVDLPIVVVRYEDLCRDPGHELGRMLTGAGLDADDARVAAAVQTSSFASLMVQELVGGFLEAPPGGGPFFRRGEADGWRDELRPDLVEQVEHDHAEVMAHLGYQPLIRASGAGGTTIGDDRT